MKIIGNTISLHMLFVSGPAGICYAPFLVYIIHVAWPRPQVLFSGSCITRKCPEMLTSHWNVGGDNAHYRATCINDTSRNMDK